MAPGTTSAARIIAGNLRVDAFTVEVLRAFEAAGVHSLLLKGPSFTRWLSASDDPRAYFDCDLLMRPADVAAPEWALKGLAFGPVLDESDMPDWWREQSSTWMRTEDGAKVDLHRTIEGVGVDPEELWRVLSDYTETLVVAGTRPTP